MRMAVPISIHFLAKEFIFYCHEPLLLTEMYAQCFHNTSAKVRR